MGKCFPVTIANGNGAADTEPSKFTSTTTISGIDQKSYSVTLGGGENTYRNFILYLVTLNKEVSITNVKVYRNDQTDPIHSNKDDFVALITARSDYKTRKQRDDRDWETFICH